MDVLKQIRRVEIRSWRLAEEYLAGVYRSVFKGRGMDFESVRAYAAGDDVRFIDWNVTARMNDTYVREFKEERELNVILVVDVSASGELASKNQNKRELAAEVAACLAFSAMSNGDKVGLVLFTDIIERFLPPMKGRRQALRVIREVMTCNPAQRRTSLRQALNFVNHVQSRRAVVIVISDFLNSNFERSLKVTGKRHDLIPIVLKDAREQSLPDVGWIVVEDAETGEFLEVNTGSRKFRDAFARLARERSEGLQHQFRRMGTDTIELATDEPYMRPIQQYMDRRMRQHHR